MSTVLEPTDVMNMQDERVPMCHVIRGTQLNHAGPWTAMCGATIRKLTREALPVECVVCAELDGAYRERQRLGLPR